MLAQFGEHINQTCNLSPAFGVSHWYDLYGLPAVATSDSSGNTRDHQIQLDLPNLTDANAGVYFCNNTKEYGSLIIYIEGILFKLSVAPHWHIIKLSSIIQ